MSCIGRDYIIHVDPAGDIPDQEDVVPQLLEQLVLLPALLDEGEVGHHHLEERRLGLQLLHLHLQLLDLDIGGGQVLVGGAAVVRVEPAGEFTTASSSSLTSLPGTWLLPPSASGRSR